MSPKFSPHDRLEEKLTRSSNTKVKRFVMYAEALESFKKVIEQTEKPNAYTVLKDLDQEKTCHIAEAADLCIMLTKGFDRSHGVYSRRGKVLSAELTPVSVFTWGFIYQGFVTDNKQDEGWKIETTRKPPLHADMVVLCTGSSPNTTSYEHLVSKGAKKLKFLALDEALRPSRLGSRFNPNKRSSVAVIGASHSAILVLRNLYNLAASGTHLNLSVKWFTRHPLRYAEEKDGWILRDNTGLKGDVATWAKENLEEDKLDGSDVSKYIRKINTAGPDGKDDPKKYRLVLDNCTHICQAVGYGRNPLPTILRGEEKLDLVFDHETGGFREVGSGNKVEGLYGAGIAFPERVTDPEGNVEMAVGLWKFMTFLKRVVPKWT